MSESIPTPSTTEPTARRWSVCCRPDCSQPAFADSAGCEEHAREWEAQLLRETWQAFHRFAADYPILRNFSQMYVDDHNRAACSQLNQWLTGEIEVSNLFITGPVGS